MLSISLTVVLLLVCGSSSTAGPSGKVLVEIEGLSTGVAANVEVSGKGRSWSVKSTTALRVSPGSYVVSIHGVRDGQATSYAADDVLQVFVPVGREVIVEAAYRITIPDSTKVADATRSPVVSIADDHVLLVRSEYADRLRVGDAIVVAEGPTTPGGLCRRVLSLQNKGGLVLAKTSPLSILEAVPNLVMRFDQADIPVVRSADRPGGSGGRGGSLDPILEFEGTLLERKHGRRKAELNVGATLDKFKLHIDGDINIRWRDAAASVAIVPSISYESEVKLEATGAIEGEKRNTVKLGACGKLIGRLPRIGPFSLGCGARGVLEGEVKVASGGIEISRGLRGAHKFPLSWQTWDLPHFAVEGWPPEADPDPEQTVRGEGSVSGKAGVEFFLGGGDFFGKIKLELVMGFFFGLKSTVDLQNLKVDVESFLEGRVDLSLDLPRRRLDAKQELLSFSWGVPPTVTEDIDEREIEPPADAVVAFKDSDGLHALRPSTGEVETIADSHRAPPMVLVSPDGRFVVGSYYPGTSGVAQSLMVWDSETSTARSTTPEDFGYLGYGFLDDSTVVGGEEFLHSGEAATRGGQYTGAYSEDEFAGIRLYFVDLLTGDVRRSGPAPSDLSSVIGAGPDRDTVLALALAHRTEDEWRRDVVKSTDLIWLDLNGKELRRSQLYDGAMIGETARSPSGRYLAATTLNGLGNGVFGTNRRERQDLVLVDLVTGQVSNLGNLYGDDRGLLRLRSLRWADDTTILVQAYAPDAEDRAITVAWRDGVWLVADGNPQVNAMAFGSNIQVIHQEQDLYLLYDRPYGERFNVFAQPGDDNNPIAYDVDGVWFPQWPQPPSEMW